MGDGITADKDRDGLLKRKTSQEGEKQASKKVVKKINLKPVYLLGEGCLCSSKTGGNIAVFLERSFWHIK